MAGWVDEDQPATAIYRKARIYLVALPCGSNGKESDCNTGDLGSIVGLGRSLGEGKWQPIPAFLPGESHGWRSLVGYSPWVCKESDTTERLHFQ